MRYIKMMSYENVNGLEQFWAQQHKTANGALDANKDKQGQQAAWCGYFKGK
jgi:hypothetical protein